MSEPRPNRKPFVISKEVVWRAYKSVKANRGAPGVDDQSIADFEADLKANLYKLWNRMSSGSYFPQPVRAVPIPKRDGKGSRMLGVPTVADRIAQTVVAMCLEPEVEPVFHPDSYGYRPGRSALDALGVCRQRCWKADWVIDLDIRSFFDSVDHDLVLKAVVAHTDQAWILLYVRRWLKAPLQHTDGSVVPRGRGTPQGSAISPLLANLFMHYAFDTWMARRFPTIRFERYCDDVVVHCVSERQALFVRDSVARRLADCRLEVHPDKTRIVYCKDSNRTVWVPKSRLCSLNRSIDQRCCRCSISTGCRPVTRSGARALLRHRLRVVCVSDHEVDNRVAGRARPVHGPQARGCERLHPL